MKRGLLLAVVGIAVALAACKPPPPPPPPPAPAPAVAPSPSAGFDTCAAPSTSVMTAWTSSAYTSVGVYIGGANRGCSQPNLTKSWVSTVTGQGWRLLPIWVGPQASCTTLGGTTKITADPGQAFAEGAAQGSAAANAAQGLGFGWLAPVYYDMEAYPRGGQCTASVQNFIGGWVQGLNARGYRAGFYSSLCSGILDEAAATGNASLTPLNAIWIAAWNDTPNIFGFGAPCALSDSLWINHQRVHQYAGGHDEAHGGVTLNIDSNAVDGPTVP
jgi:Domain of unknown function (DUF1906)